MFYYIVRVAASGDKTLTPDDAAGMLDELLEAQNKPRIFGLKLNLPLHIVDSIHSTYSQPCDRLLQVLIEFTKRTDPRPTWRVIVDALRSPAVDLPHLAKKVEATHFPDPTGLARGGIRDEESERNKEELVRAPQNQPRNQVRECAL